MALSKKAKRGLVVALGYREDLADEFETALFAFQPITDELKRNIIVAMARTEEANEVIRCLISDGPHPMSDRAYKRFLIMLAGSGNLSTMAAIDEIIPLMTGAFIPVCPLDLAILAGNGEVTPTWSSVPEADSYNLYWNTTGFPNFLSTKIEGAVSGVPISGFTNGVTYYFFLTAINELGESQCVNPVVSVEPIAPEFILLAYSGITNVGSSVITGDIGVYPIDSIIGFPPGTVSGTIHHADTEAQNALIAAQAIYDGYVGASATTIPSALDSQTLTAGVYEFASGAATLAESGAGTLTFSGSASDVFVVRTASTLRTGAGGMPTITLTGGALASNVYWIVGSSATINIGVSSAGAAFYGVAIAAASVTVTQDATVQGSLTALSGAVTLSAATTAGS